MLSDMLLTDFIQRDATCLPSPEQLKRKIILKVINTTVIVLKLQIIFLLKKNVVFQGRIATREDLEQTYSD